MLTDRIVEISWQAAQVQPGEEADGGVIGAELAGDAVGERGVEDDGIGGRDHFETYPRLARAEGEEICKLGPDPACDPDKVKLEPLKGAVDGDRACRIEARHRQVTQGGGETLGQSAGRAAGGGAKRR